MFADGLDEEVFEGGVFAASAEIGEGAFGDEAAFMDDGDAVAEALDDFEDVGGEKDGGTPADEVEEEVFHEAGPDGVDPFERFVHEKELRTVDEGGRHGDAFAHALGVFGDEFAAGIGEFKEVDEFAGTFGGERLGESVHAADEFEVFGSGEAVEEEGFVRDKADALAGAEAGFRLIGIDGFAE